jgi:putative tryptophan/tyrosine transport system substrate-binding protein
VIDRRAFIGLAAGGLLAAPLAAAAQQPEKLYRIGMLERTSTVENAANVEGFRRGLRELGYIEGKTFVIEYRSSDGRDERFPNLAADLVRLKVDLIVTRGTPAALAAKRATRTIPVVMAGVGDPVGQGIVASLARPGGNITGLGSFMTEVSAKRVELLRELVPGAARIAALMNMSNPNLPAQWNEIERAARSLGIQPHSTCESPRISGRRSLPRSGSGPTHSSLGLIPSHRRTSSSLWTSRQSIGYRRCMHPGSFQGDWSSTG